MPRAVRRPAEFSRTGEEKPAAIKAVHAGVRAVEAAEIASRFDQAHGESAQLRSLGEASRRVVDEMRDRIPGIRGE